MILIGEMRDFETTEIALEAAETGHLVLSTLHTIDASKTVDRIIGLYPEERRASDSHASGPNVPLHRFAAFDSARRRQWSHRRSRDTEIEPAHARVHRDGRSRRQVTTRCDA